MTDSARYGLQQLNSARANAAQAPVFPAAAKAGAALPIGTLTQPQAPAYHHPTTTSANGAAGRETMMDGIPPTTGRLSGGKRDYDTAVATDTINIVPGSALDAPRPAKKQKITYILPHQNMEEGHFYVVLGEDIDVSTGRFKILSLLGEGTFGKVVEAWDRKHKMHCAVKIVRNVPKYSRDAKVEIGYMEKVRAADPDDKFCFMKILRHFQNDSKHVCIVMPKYGPCLLDFIQKYGPFNHRALAEIVFQSGCSLDYFHSELRLMHTDLKPENMLLETDATVTDPVTGKTQVRLPVRMRFCDLGGCCDDRHSRTAIVSTRHYRSPEVILGLGWMYSTDIWSMGCIIYELFTGKLLYDTHDNQEHLHLLEKTIGRLPADWPMRCMDEAKILFTSAGQLRPLSDPKHMARVSRARPIRELIPDRELCDLITQCLHYDRSKRLTAREMAVHPYVLKYYPEAMQSPLFPSNRVGMPPTNF